MLPRRAVKLALCGDSRARDANIRQALIDRFGGSAAVGRKAAPGPLYGISRDVWSALAIAVTYTLRGAQALLGGMSEQARRPVERDPLVAALARYVEALHRRYPDGPDQMRREGLDGRANITGMAASQKDTAA